MIQIACGALRKQCRPGQATVELAVAATVLVILLFAIVEMGIVVYRYNLICSAAREAVRSAIVNCTTSAGCSSSATTTIKNAAINSAPFLGTGNITVNTPADPTDSTKNDAQVLISYTYAMQIPLLNSISFTLTSSSQMMLSH